MKKNGNITGRPSLWVNPEVLQKLVDSYFETEKQPTLSGLAISLGISRSTLYNYKQKDDFLDIIKKARAKVENAYEKLLIYAPSSPTGVIFALKNMGWADSQKIDHSTLGKELPAPIYGGKSTGK